MAEKREALRDRSASAGKVAKRGESADVRRIYGTVTLLQFEGTSKL